MGRTLQGLKRKRLVEKTRRLMGKGYSDQEICDALTIKTKTLVACKQDILNFDKTFFEHLDSGTVYSDYLLKAKQNTKDLNKLINTTNIKSAQGSEKAAFVAAIKLRSELQDKCVKLGQDLGFIDRQSKVVDINLDGEVNFNFQNKTDAEIRKEIELEKKRLDEIASGKVIEMRPELLGVTDKEVTKYFPPNVVSKQRAKNTPKVTLRK